MAAPHDLTFMCRGSFYGWVQFGSTCSAQRGLSYIDRPARRWTCRFDLRRIVAASRAECAHPSVQTVGSALDRTVQIAIERYVRI